MPYKKKYKKRRTYKKKAKGANDKTVTVWSDHSVLEKANKALNLASKVYRFVNTEIKYHDTIVTAGVVPNTGTINGLSDMAQGDSSQDRDGMSAKLLNLTLRGYLQHNAASAFQNHVRVIIFRGKQENGTGFAATDILETATIHSPKNYTDRFRTKILYDQLHSIPLIYSGNNSRKIIPPVNIKLNGHVNYSGVTTAIEAGGLYILYLGSQATNTPTMYYHARLTYVDN